MERLMRWRGTQTQAISDGDALRAAAQSGDRAALERLLAPHERPLYALCLGMLSHVGDAEDAVQETFLRALGALPRFRGDAHVRTWLTRIAVRVCLDNRRAARPTVPIPADTALASPEASILSRLEILDALRALPPRPRLIFLLKEMEGWDAREIAGALHCTTRHVYHELDVAGRALAAWRVREGDAR